MSFSTNVSSVAPSKAYILIGYLVCVTLLLTGCRKGIMGYSSDLIEIRIGSKGYLEQDLLCHSLKKHLVEKLKDAGGKKLIFKCVRDLMFSHSDNVYQALKNGRLHIYFDYTGTLYRNHLKCDLSRCQKAGYHAVEKKQCIKKRNEECAKEKLPKDQITVVHDPENYENNYLFVMKRAKAAALNIWNISDLKCRRMRFGFTREFGGKNERKDGWDALKSHYKLDQPQNKQSKERCFKSYFEQPALFDNETVYRALALDEVDVIDAYSTDPQLLKHDVRILKDDQSFFTPYKMLVLYSNTYLRCQFLPGGCPPNKSKPPSGRKEPKLYQQLIHILKSIKVRPEAIRHINTFALELGVEPVVKRLQVDCFFSGVRSFYKLILHGCNQGKKGAK